MRGVAWARPPRHIRRKTTKPRTMTPTMTAAMIMELPFPRSRSHRGDHDGPRRVVLDHDHAGAGLDRQVGGARVRVERLRAAPHRNHDLAQAGGTDDPGHAGPPPHHPVVGPTNPPRAPKQAKAPSPTWGGT